MSVLPPKLGSSENGLGLRRQLNDERLGKILMDSADASTIEVSLEDINTRHLGVCAGNYPYRIHSRLRRGKLPLTKKVERRKLIAGYSKRKFGIFRIKNTEV